MLQLSLQSTPDEAGVGVVEVKSALTSALKRACGKRGEHDEYLDATGAGSPPPPFRFVFGYRLDTADPFNGWGLAERVPEPLRGPGRVSA